jgi:ornithine lipid ester-linked acyl 2-hydroxylase
MKNPFNKELPVFQPIDAYAFLKPLRDNWTGILDEWMKTRQQDPGKFWYQEELHNNRWRLNLLMHQDEKHPAWDRYPFTTRLLEGIPGLYVATFSLMEPGCVIHPHRGYQEVPVWRSHLGLICPPTATITVSSHTYEWKAGEMVVFDDRRKHSAVNPTDQERLILIVDFRQ